MFFLPIIALALFYWWAGRGKLAKHELAKIKNYAQNPSPNLTEFKIITFNIGYLSGMTNNLPVDREKNLFNKHLEKVVEVFGQEKPDLIAFQEIDYASKRSFYVNQSEEIAKKCGFNDVADAINWDKNYLPFPYFPIDKHFRRILSGQSLHSKFPILEQQRIILKPLIDAPFYYKHFYLDRLAQLCLVQIQNKILVIINLHLEAFDLKTRLIQCKQVCEIYTKYAQNYPVFLLGDFNALAPNEALKINKNYDSSIDYVLSLPKIKSVLPINHFSEPDFLTFPTDKPLEQIDYIFYNSDKIEMLDYKILKQTETSSDHFPILMKFKFVD